MRPKERLLRRGKSPNDERAMRNALEAWSDRLSHWTEGFTFLVVSGLIVEYLPEIAYFLRFFLLASFATAVQGHAEQLRQLGGFLVIVGVGGELWIEVRASRVETDLREENNVVITRADERIAFLNLLVEQERSARIKIQEKFKSRKLEPQLFSELVEALAPYAGTRIDVFAFDSHIPEVHLLADALNAACLTADCDSKLWLLAAGHRMPGDGVTLGIARGSTLEERELFSRFTSAVGTVLAKADIKFVYCFGGFSKTDPAVPNSVAGYEPWNSDDVALFRIQVVEKNVLDPWIIP